MYNDAVPENTHKFVLFAIALSCAGFATVAAQQPAKQAVFTSAQADAGRMAYENSCGKCHTVSLRGRKGDAGEVPPLESLTTPFLKFIGPAKRVPPLMGSGFVGSYSTKTMAGLFTLFRGAADTTPVAELQMSDETLVNITAYILQRNGAKPGDQPLTKASDVVFSSIL
jgi:hypothetical protein